MLYALVTGASKGIGKAIAYELASKKINVLLIARSENILAGLVADIKSKHGVEANYLAIDLTAPHVAKQIFDWCNQNNYAVNILVNNAGYGLAGKFDNYSADEHIALININVITPVELISAFLPLLKQQEKAFILNIGSSSAYQAVPYLSTYSGSKVFIVNFTRSLHFELRKTNVSATVVSPGVTDTEFPLHAKVPEKGKKAADKIAMTPEAVAKIAVRSMFKRKTEVTAGFITKVGIFLAWLLPKKLAEKTGASFYE